MKILCFVEKHGHRYIEGETLEAIAKVVLQERINDTYGYGESIWYVEDTENAIKALHNNQAFEYLESRSGYEYEDFYEVTLENQ